MIEKQQIEEAALARFYRNNPNGVIKYKTPPQSVIDFEAGANWAIEQMSSELQRAKEENEVEAPKIVGILNKPWGMNGYHKAEIGHPVYEAKERYIIYLTSDNHPTVAVPFYKETLHQAINYNNPVNL